MEALRFKIAVLVLLFLFIIIGVYIFLQYPLEVPKEEGDLWMSDMDAAKSEAMNEYKPILAFFFTEINEDCKRMEDETFNNNTLMTFLAEKFVLVKLNYNTNPYWTGYYSVKTVPTIIFASNKGEKIRSLSGFKDANAFYREALKALEEWKEK